jgi:hypothetical protein
MTFSAKALLGRILIALLNLTVLSAAIAQQKTPSIAPAEKLRDGWEEIDDRLVFLMVRLANAETSLAAVEKQLGINQGAQNAASRDGKKADERNELMDRFGGGPVKWSDFYGKTAEKFFYHPVDPSTSYHTTTVLTQQRSMPQQTPGSVQASQGVPVSQRPPQFDYIYRANEEAKARAEKEAAELKSKRDALIARRKALEEEQSSLWCEVAFRAVSHYDLDRKPLYRFEPIAASSDDEAKRHLALLRAAVVFMRQALSVVSQAQKDQARAFSGVKVLVSDNREKLDDVWLRQGVETSNRNAPENRFVALAKRLDDVSNNLSDSYKVSVDGERFKDELRKNTFRGLLQESLVTYAESVLALDEMASLMASQWKVKPDIDRPLAISIQPTGNTGHASADMTSREPSPGKGVPGPLVLSGQALLDFVELGTRAQPSAAGGVELLSAKTGPASKATSHEVFRAPLIAQFKVVAHSDGVRGIWPSVCGVNLNWGTEFNKKTLVSVEGGKFQELQHTPIVAEKENDIRIAIDADNKVTISVNGKQIFEQKVAAAQGLSGKIILGGGLGHVEYREVTISSSRD